MKIDAYMKKHKIARKDMAAALGISQAYLSQICTGERRPSKYIALLIEQETAGIVKAKALRPDMKASALALSVPVAMVKS